MKTKKQKNSKSDKKIVPGKQAHIMSQLDRARILIQASFVIEEEAVAHREHKMNLTADNQFDVRNDLIESACDLLECVKHDLYSYEPKK